MRWYKSFRRVTRSAIKATAATPVCFRASGAASPAGTILDAKVIGIDRESDLAVIKIEQTDLPFLRFGRSEDLRQGQVVLAMGNPLGLANSVSMGVISSVARQLKPDDTMIYIQT